MNNILTLLGGIINFIALGYYGTVDRFAPMVIAYFSEKDEELKWRHHLQILMTLMISTAAMRCVGGLLATKMDFKIPLILSTLFTSLGILLSYFTVKANPIFFFLTHGVICGIGIGLSHTIVIWVVLKWYQRNPHLAIGAVLSGIGLGSILFSQIQNSIVKPMQCLKDSDELSECPTVLKVPSVFVIVGSIVFTLQIMGISLMRRYKEEFSDFEFKSPEDKNNAEEYPQAEVTPRSMFRMLDFYLLWSYQFIMCFLTFFAVSSYKIFGLLYLEDNLIVHRISESAVAFLIAGYAFWCLLISRISYKISQFLLLIVWGVSIALLPPLMVSKYAQAYYAISIYILHMCLAGQTVFILTATFKLFGIKFFAINFALVRSAEVPGGIIFDILATELQLNKHMFGGLHLAIGGIVCGLILVILMADPFAPACMSSSLCMRARKRDKDLSAYNDATEEDGLPNSLTNV